VYCVSRGALTPAVNINTDLIFLFTLLPQKAKTLSISNINSDDTSPLMLSTSSLSGLSDRSEGKTGLKQISWVFEANSWLFNEKMREIWPNPAFP
jgi:hypothetical protein